jgi:hypothetical protein
MVEGTAGSAGVGGTHVLVVVVTHLGRGAYHKLADGGIPVSNHNSKSPPVSPSGESYPEV